jgi:hypothetical protein
VEAVLTEIARGNACSLAENRSRDLFATLESPDRSVTRSFRSNRLCWATNKNFVPPKSTSGLISSILSKLPARASGMTMNVAISNKIRLDIQHQPSWRRETSSRAGLWLRTP